MSLEGYKTNADFRLAQNTVQIEKLTKDLFQQQKVKGGMAAEIEKYHATVGSKTNDNKGLQRQVNDLKSQVKSLQSTIEGKEEFETLLA